MALKRDRKEAEKRGWEIGGNILKEMSGQWDLGAAMYLAQGATAMLTEGIVDALDAAGAPEQGDKYLKHWIDNLTEALEKRRQSR